MRRRCPAGEEQPPNGIAQEVISHVTALLAGHRQLARDWPLDPLGLDPDDFAVYETVMRVQWKEVAT